MNGSRDDTFGSELCADAFTLQIVDAAENARFIAARVAGDSATTVAGGFGVMVIVVLVNVHALLSLDRFRVAPLATRRFELLGVYLALILLPAVAGMVLPFVVDHKKHAKWLQGTHSKMYSPCW